MYFRRPLAAALAVAGLALLGTACLRRGAQNGEDKKPGPLRLAILPVEDQRTVASETWPSRVLPVALARQLSSSPLLAARAAGSVPDAWYAGATHLVHTRLVGTGASARLMIDLETRADQSIELLNAVPAGDGNWLKGARSAARALAAKLLPGSGKLAEVGVPDEAAFKRLGEALMAPTPDVTMELLVQTTSDAPACGWCWEALAETAIRLNRREEAVQSLTQSRQAAGIDETSRARLDLLESGLTSSAALRAEALRKLARLTPSNVEVVTELANSATRSRNWAEAVKAWKLLLSVDPESADALNQLGYVEAWQGRFDEAVKWLNAFIAAQPGSPNPADSLGEVLMMAGRFQEAERSFASSFEKGPEFNAGAAMEKAALACWLRGDETAARQRLDQFLKSRTGHGDMLVDWRRARWLYITGKPDEARQLLLTVRSSGPPPVKAFSLASLALWSAESGDRAAALKYVSEIASVNHPAAQKILPLVASIVNPASVRTPNPLSEGMAAIMAGDNVKAIAALKKALETSAPGDDGQARELLAWAYVRTGNLAAAGDLLRAGWPLPATIEGQLTDFLIYPNLFYVRARIAEHNGDPAAAKYFEAYIKYLGSRPDPQHQKGVSLKAVRL